MTDLQPAGAWGGGEAAQPQPPARSRNSGSGAAPVRPRIGTGPRTRRRRRARIDAGVIVRSVGISAAVLVVVFGGLLALHLFAPPRPAAAVAEIPVAVPAPKRSAAPAQHGAEPAAAAMRAAAVLNAAGAAAPSRVDPSPAPPETTASVQSPADSGASAAAAAAPAQAPPAQGPTPADFTRPAFLEPRRVAAGDSAVEGEEDDTVAAATPTPSATQSRDSDVTASVRRTGRISSAINLRNAPRRSAEVIGTLEAGTKVDIFSCKSWCEVAADGKRGYVYARAVDQ